MLDALFLGTLAALALSPRAREVLGAPSTITLPRELPRHVVVVIESRRIA